VYYLGQALCFTNVGRNWKCACSSDSHPEEVGDKNNPGYSCKDFLENSEEARITDGIY